MTHDYLEKSLLVFHISISINTKQILQFAAIQHAHRIYLATHLVI